VTEEGNDLNRNFVDHTKPYPHNPGYEEIADAVGPALSADLSMRQPKGNCRLTGRK